MCFFFIIIFSVFVDLGFPSLRRDPFHLSFEKFVCLQTSFFLFFLFIIFFI